MSRQEASLPKTGKDLLEVMRSGRRVVWHSSMSCYRLDNWGDKCTQAANILIKAGLAKHISIGWGDSHLELTEIIEAKERLARLLERKRAAAEQMFSYLKGLESNALIGGVNNLQAVRELIAEIESDPADKKED